MQTIVLNNIYSKLMGDKLPPKIILLLSDTLSYKLTSSYFMAKNANKKNEEKKKKNDWDGTFKMFWEGDKVCNFYTGMTSEVIKILQLHKIPYRIVDNRNRPEINCPQLQLTPIKDEESRPYQDWTVDLCYKATRGIIEASAGSGKTYIVTKLINKIKTVPFLFLVLSTDLLDQAYDTLSRCLNVPIGKIGDGCVDIKDINVMTIQTAIKAMHINDKKFLINQYKYDENDNWNDDTIEKNLDRAIGIQNLIKNANGIYMDECVSGNTKIFTEKGRMNISDIKKKKCRFVLTYDGTNVLFKPILNYWIKGKRNTIRINLQNGKSITCTKEHLILTKRGWLRAEQIQKTDEMLYTNAVAGVEHKFKETNVINNKKNIFLGTNVKKEVWQNGKEFMPYMLIPLQNVLVDVGQKSHPKALVSLLSAKAIGNFLNILGDTTNNQYGQNITLNQLLQKNKQSLEHVSEIHPFLFPTIDLKTTDSLPIIAKNNWNGLNTNLTFYQDTASKLNAKLITVLDKDGLVCDQGVCRLLHLLQNKCIDAIKKELLQNYWINLEILEWLGGFVTMAVLREDVPNILCYTRKGGIKKKIQLWLRGLKNKDIFVKFLLLQIENQIMEFIITYFFQNNHLTSYLKEYRHLSQSVCNTKWQKVQSILKSTKQTVYDIEVKDTNCFFANNILVHNCHHVSCKVVKEVLRFAKNVYWRYGGSATPYRDDGAEVMIQALFGKKTVCIPASFLIKHNFLVKPYIFNVKINYNFPSEEDFKSYSNIYSKYIVKNNSLHQLTIDILNYFEEKNITTLILVQQYEHGENLKKIRPDLVFIKGNQPKKQRKQALQDLRDGKIKSAIATTLADEGLDIPKLGAVIVAGGGKSVSRVYQRVGRTIRKFPGKDKAFVVLFQHDCRYLDRHGRRVCSLLRKEKEFVIRQSDSENILPDLKKYV